MPALSKTALLFLKPSVSERLLPYVSSPCQPNFHIPSPNHSLTMLFMHDKLLLPASLKKNTSQPLHVYHVPQISDCSLIMFFRPAKSAHTQFQMLLMALKSPHASLSMLLIPLLNLQMASHHNPQMFHAPIIMFLSSAKFYFITSLTKQEPRLNTNRLLHVRIKSLGWLVT